jgi:uncharacterized protein YwqG
MDQAFLARLIQEAGLLRIREFLLQSASPCIRIGTKGVDPAQLKLGEPRLGGLPDLPQGMTWPLSREGEPLAFLAQLRMEDSASCDAEGVLPKQGHLFFFYDSSQEAWGFDPKHRGMSKVFHSAGVPLVRTAAPRRLADACRFKSCALRFARAWSLAGFIQRKSAGLDLSEKEEEGCDDLEESIGREIGIEGTRHQLLGRADPVQNEMELECQLASNGVYCGNPEGYRDPRAKNLKKGAADWRLLLQVDSDDTAAMMWGDLGRVYFWIRKQDLAQRNFDGVWTILQCG